MDSSRTRSDPPGAELVSASGLALDIVSTLRMWVVALGGDESGGLQVQCPSSLLSFDLTSFVVVDMFLCFLFSNLSSDHFSSVLPNIVTSAARAPKHYDEGTLSTRASGTG